MKKLKDCERKLQVIWLSPGPDLRSVDLLADADALNGSIAVVYYFTGWQEYHDSLEQKNHANY